MKLFINFIKIRFFAKILSIYLALFLTSLLHSTFQKDDLRPTFKYSSDIFLFTRLQDSKILYLIFCPSVLTRLDPIYLSIKPRNCGWSFLSKGRERRIASRKLSLLFPSKRIIPIDQRRFSKFFHVPLYFYSIWKRLLGSRDIPCVCARFGWLTNDARFRNRVSRLGISWTRFVKEWEWATRRYFRGCTIRHPGNRKIINASSSFSEGSVWEERLLKFHAILRSIYFLFSYYYQFSATLMIIHSLAKVYELVVKS